MGAKGIANAASEQLSAKTVIYIGIILGGIAAVAIVLWKLWPKLGPLLGSFAKGEFLVGKPNAAGLPTAGGAATFIFGSESAERYVNMVDNTIKKGASLGGPVGTMISAVTGVDPNAGFVDMDRQNTYDHISRIYATLRATGNLSLKDEQSIKQYLQYFERNEKIDPVRASLQQDASKGTLLAIAAMTGIPIPW